MKNARLILLVLFLLISGGSLMAQESHETGSGPAAEHPSFLKETVYPWVNFIILAGAMVYILKKPARDFFSSQKEGIATGLERGRKAEEDANQRMAEIEKRLGRLSADLTTLRSQAETESSRERDVIVGEARREVTRVVEQSRQEIDRIARSIERDIKDKIADAVIQRAGESLETQMTEDDQKRIVVRFLKKA